MNNAILNNPLCLAAWLALSAACLGDSSPPDPESWYRDGYAPLWADNPGENVEAMLAYYAERVETHRADGKITREDKRAWLSGPMQQWLAEGWLDSDLVRLGVDRINATTAAFKAGWLDRYQNGEQELSCGWYLADFIEGRWQFTAYADIDCAATPAQTKK